MNIVMIGMPGSGKSTVGALLAQRLKYAFLDVDALIVKAYGAPSLQKVLDDLGNEGFLDAEARIIAGLDCHNTVVSPGGSAVLREAGARHLKALGPVVYLDPPYAVLEKRLGNLAVRGVTLAPGQTLRELWEYRGPFYQKYADVVGDSDQPSAQDTVELICRALEL